MKKKQPDQKFLSTKHITGSPQFLERCYNELIRIIETKFSTWLFNHRYIPEKRTMFLPRFRIG